MNYNVTAITSNINSVILKYNFHIYTFSSSLHILRFKIFWIDIIVINPTIVISTNERACHVWFPISWKTLFGSGFIDYPIIDFVINLRIYPKVYLETEWDSTISDYLPLCSLYRIKVLAHFTWKSLVFVVEYFLYQFSHHAQKNNSLIDLWRDRLIYDFIITVFCYFLT